MDVEVQALLKQGVDPDAREQGGMTAPMLAEKLVRPDVVELLKNTQ